MAHFLTQGFQLDMSKIISTTEITICSIVERKVGVYKEIVGEVDNI